MKQKTALKRSGPLKRTLFKNKEVIPLKRNSTLKTYSQLKSKAIGSGEGRVWSKFAHNSSFKRSLSVLKQGKELKKTPWKNIDFLKKNNLKRITKIKTDPRGLVYQAKKFHNEVWAMFGDKCVLCTKSHPAESAAHVIKRSFLGNLRYADPRFARPAHQSCHVKQEENCIHFSFAIRLDAVRVYNLLTKNSPIMEPTS